MTPRRVLMVLSLAELCAMAPWFSASAVSGTLTRLWDLSSAGAAWLTVSVQLGFVTGALVSSALALSDLWSARRLFAWSAAAAALATAAVIIAPTAGVAFALRFLTGAALAGAYPPGMKLAAGWFRTGRGTAIGVMVGALTLGSALPHLVRWMVPAEAWKLVVAVAALSALAGAALILVVPSDGPYAAPSPPFSWSAVPRILERPPIRLANLGYLGHMWEVYAMWTWVGAFIAASEAARDPTPPGRSVAPLVTFAVVGIGAPGSWLGGILADRWGRVRTTTVAMIVSGSCALFVGALFGQSLLLLVPILFIWGVSVVADSAQFSTAISELAPPEYVGTALTLQTSLGFLLTCVTILLLPVLASHIGWRWSMAALAVGPALGVWAMLALGRRPEASLLAGGLG
ncbi:MAG TPA: MFS transporter [Gemmatimonadales bacterium]|nr:MFS transporter [Gemmatimonadales bacterium]